MHQRIMAASRVAPEEHQTIHGIVSSSLPAWQEGITPDSAIGPNSGTSEYRAPDTLTVVFIPS